MSVSWAAKAAEAQTPKAPTPEDRLAALAEFYCTLSQKAILEEALGKNNLPHPKTPEIARKLVEHTVVICVDTESHTLNTDQMTELGMNYVSRKTVRELGNPGPHGHKIQEALRFFHFRVVEHAHLKSNRVDSLGPLGNRFGYTRFLTFLELRVILHHLFNQVIATDDAELKGCKHPIVLVGHALKHDTENTSKKGLEYDIDANTTVVAKVDTQALAREVGLWIPPADMKTNEIGLRVMIERLGFAHLDDHTACNDAARTMMCAICMIMPEKLRQGTFPTMQQVADRVEALSRITSPPSFGTEKCCTRCGDRDHSLDTCSASVRCEACDRFDIGLDCENAVTSHIEMYCPHVARFKAWARRYRDAMIKKRAPAADIAVGPGDAHPWSTWPPSLKWSLRELSDVLVGFNLITHDQQFSEPPAHVRNLASALDGLPVPPTGNWYQATSVGSDLLQASGTHPRLTIIGSSSSPHRQRSTTVSSPRSALDTSPRRAVAGAAGSPTPAARLRAPTTSASAPVVAATRTETTMSEQRERARRAAGEKTEKHCGSAGRSGPPGNSGSVGTWWW